MSPANEDAIIMDVQQVIQFLQQNPEFISEHPDLLACINLPNPQTGNVASLHTRQLETLRERVRQLESRLGDINAAATDNQAIIDKLLITTRVLLAVKNEHELPGVLVGLIKAHFSVPIVRMHLWLDDPISPSADDNPKAQAWFTERRIIDDLSGLYCGFAEHAPTLHVFEAEPSLPRSVVLIPLRAGLKPNTFGVLGLGSLDKDRFAPTLETDFLNNLAQTACAALSRIQMGQGAQAIIAV